MKAGKKIALFLTILSFPMLLLTGCNSGSNSTTQNKAQVSYDKTNLTEKKISGVKFFTSMADKWEEKESQGFKMTMLQEKSNGTNISILKDKNNRLIPDVDKWDAISTEKIKKMLSIPGVENLDVNQTEVSGKKAFKVTYQVKTLKGEQYYIRLSDEETAVVTYTEMKSMPEYQKELQNVINTIETE